MGHPAKKETAPHSLRTNLIFGEGNAIHTKWQTWLGEMGILWGRWQCIHCQELIAEWSDNLPVKSGCPALVGGVHEWKYREVPLTAEDVPLIKGHSDGIINPTTEESMVLEAKSVGPGTLRKLDVLSETEDNALASSRFSRITRPEGEHFRQAQIYMRLAQQRSITNVVGPINRAVVLYEHKADQQVREFVITYNPRWTEDLWSTAKDIEWAVKNDREIRCPYGGCSQCEIYKED